MKYLKNRLIVLMLMLMIPNAWTLADYCPKQYEIG